MKHLRKQAKCENFVNPHHQTGYNCKIRYSLEQWDLQLVFKPNLHTLVSPQTRYGDYSRKNQLHKTFGQSYAFATSTDQAVSHAAVRLKTSVSCKIATLVTLLVKPYPRNQVPPRNISETSAFGYDHDLKSLNI
ncbi:hypothetical protein KC19_4G131900 [Ceratodon purpureus]|uniref:Uncharacterized protein n=1 Tax=Ceratodon purpureus TaxID=3225 RepID=A0A8T0I883_CERPU|nr:hypothetical protein KC19_4G131900 [Ceratodon purpureus]